MASDHRGRALHAGKRTTQDTPNAVSGWSTDASGRQIPHIVEDAAFDRGDEPNRMAGYIKLNKAGRWDAALYRPHDYLSHDYLSGRSWAESDLALRLDEVNNRLDSPHTASGDYRTEKRAKIAVEAMINRRNEGRDYKTGRGPSYPKGSNPGHPY